VARRRALHTASSESSSSARSLRACFSALHHVVRVSYHGSILAHIMVELYHSYHGTVTQL
jgi:hypothetical protein